MGGSANSLKLTFSLSLNPPVPIAATIVAANGDVSVTFNRDLITGPLDPLNWAVRANLGPMALNHTVVGIPQAAVRTVSFGTVPGGIAFPPLGVDYNAAPPDVRDTRGLPAAAFADFPIAVI